MADVGGVRLRWHARRLRGERTLAEAARLAGLNRDELSRIERGQTRQIRFETLAKLIVAYHCELSQLLEVETVPAEHPQPLYAPAVQLFADGVLSTPVRRRSVRRDGDADTTAPGDERSFGSSTGQTAGRRRRAPIGTVSR